MSKTSDYGGIATLGEDHKPLMPSHGSPRNSPPGQYSRIAVFLIFFFPALGGLLFGYDIGATSAVITQLQSRVYSGVLWYDNILQSSYLQGVITSIGMFGAMLGSMTCFLIGDSIGRKRTLIAASVFFIFGSSFEAFSGKSTWEAKMGISILIIGRFIYGYGCGFAMHGAPAYIGEMSPTQIRGVLVSLKEAFIVLGMVFGYTIGYFCSNIVGGWRYTYMASAPIAFLMFIGMCFLPYSARWLALKGRESAARSALKWVTPNIEESELEFIKEIANKVHYNPDDGSSWDKLTSPTIFPALVAGVGLVFLQQVTGQPSVLYYADSIFEDIGLSTIASIGVSVFKLIATLFATVTVDNYGRKLLLYIGCSLMMVALLVLGGAFFFPYTSAEECYSYKSETDCLSTCAWSLTCGEDCTTSGYDDDVCACCGTSGLNNQKAIILTALFVYIGGYQVGFGPISWLIISEIFPLEVRGKAVSIAVVTNFFWNFIMAFIFPIELELVGTSATFFIYAFVLGIGICFIFYKVPETKGLSLEQIEQYFVRASMVASSQSPSSTEKKGGGPQPL